MGLGCSMEGQRCLVSATHPTHHWTTVATMVLHKKGETNMSQYLWSERHIKLIFIDLLGPLFIAKQQKKCVSGCGQSCEWVWSVLWASSLMMTQWGCRSVVDKWSLSSQVRTTTSTDHYYWEVRRTWQYLLNHSPPPGIWVNIWDWFVCETWINLVWLYTVYEIWTVVKDGESLEG